MAVYMTYHFRKDTLLYFDVNNSLILYWHNIYGVTTIFFFFIFFSWVEIRLHAEFQLHMLLRSGSFMVVEKKPEKNTTTHP